MFNRNDLTYGLRDPDILVLSKFQTITYGKNTFRYHGVWNLLPGEVKLFTTVDNCKLMMKA